MQSQSSSTTRATPEPQQNYARWDGAVFRVMTITEANDLPEDLGDRTLPVTLVLDESQVLAKLLIEGGTDRITKRAKPLSNTDPTRRAKAWLSVDGDVYTSPHAIYYLVEGADLNLLASPLDWFLGWDIRGKHGHRFELANRF